MSLQQSKNNSVSGFTIPEVIIAGTILAIICVGTAQTYILATRINRGNNLRMQALSVLQQEVEYYRSLKFIPGLETDADLPNHRKAELYAGTHVRPTRIAADGRIFNISVQVVNLTPSTEERLVRFKRLTITATPTLAENEGWLQNLGTSVAVERVRSN
jgi:type II secretory pathway pseudopilin PulG